MLGMLRAIVADPYFKMAFIAVTSPVSYCHRRILLKKYLASEKEHKLHLGCGCVRLKGWLNSDYRMRNGAVRLNAGKPFPLPSNLMYFIYSEHLFEHLSLKQGMVMLKESFRVLKPGGKMRLVTPDLCFFLSLCDQNINTDRKKFVELSIAEFYSDMPVKNATTVLNYAFQNWGHQFLYDYDTLKFVLQKVGFVDIQRGTVSHSENSVFQNLESRDRGDSSMRWLNKMESMVVEAKKP